MSDQDTTITADGLEQMLDQFRGATNLRKLATTYLDQVQAFEDAAWPLLAERSIDNATGDRLDGLGQIANVARGGRSDADYRLRLKAEFLILSSSGTAEEMLTIAQALVQMTTADYDMSEHFPKGLVIRPVDFAVTSGADVIGAGLKRASSAGTSTHFVHSYKDDSGTFTLSSQGATTESSTTLGLGSGANLESSWDFDATSTVLSGLASGYYRLNSATFADVTEMYIHDEDNISIDNSIWLATMSGEHLRLLTAAEDNQEFYVQSVTDNTGTFTFSVIPLVSVGTIVTDELVGFYESPTGGHLSGVT